MSLDSHSPLEKPVQPSTTDGRPNFLPFDPADRGLWRNIASSTSGDAGRVVNDAGLPNVEIPVSTGAPGGTRRGTPGKSSDWVQPVTPPTDHALPASRDGIDQTRDVSPMLMPPRPEDWVKPEVKPGVSVEAARQAVEDAAEKNLAPAEARQLKADMEKFEARAKSDHLSDQQVADTYQNVEQLLNAKAGPLEANDRHLLAEQVMAISADPNKARTGSESGTCGPVELETLIYKNSPADAANVVAQVAMSGQYQAADGTTVVPDMLATDESRRTGDASARLFASQIFQNSTIDANLKASGSNLTYHHEYGANETGAGNEYYTDPTGTKIAFDGTTSTDLVNMYREVTGKNDLIVIDSTAAVPTKTSSVLIRLRSLKRLWIG